MNLMSKAADALSRYFGNGKRFESSGRLFVGHSQAGPTVNSTTAVSFAAVYAARRILTTAVAGSEMLVYRRLADDVRERATAHALYPVLHSAPNPITPSYRFREQLMGDLLDHGNAYALVVRDGAEVPRQLWRIPPGRVRAESKGGVVTWYITSDQGGEKPYPWHEVLHVPGLGGDGLMGLSPITEAKEAIGAALAKQEYSSRFFSNGAHVGGMLRIPHALNEEQRAQWQERLKHTFAGLGKAHHAMVLEAGMEWENTGADPEKSQLLESLKFSVTEVSRVFGVPPSLLADLAGGSFNNTEQQQQAFLVWCLAPWLQRIASYINFRLLGGDYYADWMVESLLKASTEARFRAYDLAIRGGWMMRNEARRRENLPPIDGLDEPLLLPGAAVQGATGQSSIPPGSESDS